MIPFKLTRSKETQVKTIEKDGLALDFKANPLVLREQLYLEKAYELTKLVELKTKFEYLEVKYPQTLFMNFKSDGTENFSSLELEVFDMYTKGLIPENSESFKNGDFTAVTTEKVEENPNPKKNLLPFFNALGQHRFNFDTTNLPENIRTAISEYAQVSVECLSQINNAKVVFLLNFRCVQVQEAKEAERKTLLAQVKELNGERQQLQKEIDNVFQSERLKACCDEIKVCNERLSALKREEYLTLEDVLSDENITSNMFNAMADFVDTLAPESEEAKIEEVGNKKKEPKQLKEVK